MNRIQLYIGIAVLLFLVGLGWFFYRRGKKQVTLQYGPGELPGNPGRGSQLGASNEEIKKIANDLYADMNGFNVFGHDYEPYQEANMLSDNDLIALYNTFNASYNDENEGTLTHWISSERYSDTTLPSLLIARLKKLNML